MLMSVSMSVVDLYSAHNRKASDALCTLVEREKTSFQVAAKTVKGMRDGSRRQSGNELQAAGPATPLQKRPDDHYAGGMISRCVDTSLVQNFRYTFPTRQRLF